MDICRNREGEYLKVLTSKEKSEIYKYEFNELDQIWKSVEEALFYMPLIDY